MKFTILPEYWINERTKTYKIYTMFEETDRDWWGIAYTKSAEFILYLN